MVAMKRDVNVLKTIIARLAETFDVLQKAQIVHADLKPDNILIDFDAASQTVTDVKLIDFGSSFQYN